VPVFFCDSSAIVKRYVKEIGTPWVLSLVAPAAGNRIYVARITSVEVVSAVTRRQRGGNFTLNHVSLQERGLQPGRRSCILIIGGGGDRVGAGELRARLQTDRSNRCRRQMRREEGDR
jgi:hypothetical protein